MRFIRLIFKVLISVLVLLIILLLLLITPGQVETSAVSSKDVAQTRTWLSDTWQQLKQDKKPIAIEVNQHQLDSIMNVATYTAKPANFHGFINDFGVNLLASIDLSSHLPGKVIQGYCLLSPADSGLTINRCQLGRIPVSGWLANHIFRLTVKTVISAPADQQLLALFARGEFRNNALHFVNEDAITLKLRVNPQLSGLRDFNKELFKAESLPVDDMLFYLNALQQFNKSNPDERRLAFYLQQMLLLAAERSANSSLMQELNSALWATIAGLGNPKFISYAHPELTSEQVPALPAMRLTDRYDLTLHFLYSAFFKKTGSSNISEKIGNLKEIYDAGGSSGFSFVDLAANYAGIHFAENISDINLETMKALSVAEFEAAFMPDIAGLPEGMSEQQMQQQFGGYQGQQFKQTEQIILNRLQQLALYR